MNVKGVSKMPFRIRKPLKTQLIRLGKKESRELICRGCSFDERILAEIRGYNREYGPASTADVVTEINTRGKDLKFQGELAYYATANSRGVQRHINRLVREGKIRVVKIRGVKPGYVA